GCGDRPRGHGRARRAGEHQAHDPRGPRGRGGLDPGARDSYPVRVGIGYDVHPLVAGRRLVLGGVHIEHPTGLDGHSDADVLTHAVIDALLGAAGLGDIGTLFPADDPRYRNASSLDMLRSAAKLLADAGYRV